MKMSFKGGLNVILFIILINHICNDLIHAQIVDEKDVIDLDVYKTLECFLLETTFVDNCVSFLESGKMPDMCPMFRKKELLNKNNNIVVLSIGHHGLGNQLFEHSFAYMLATSIGADIKFTTKATTIDDGTRISLNKDGHTKISGEAISELIDPSLRDKYIYKPDYKNGICEENNDKNNIVLYPFGPKASAESLQKIITNPDKSKPQCIKLLGYLQYMSPMRNPFYCVDALAELWPIQRFAPQISDVGITAPSGQDVAIYLRCAFYHYVFDDVKYYENILNHTTYERVWLFQSPDCLHVMHKKHFFERYEKVYNLLTKTYNATVWTTGKSTDNEDGNNDGNEVNRILTDFGGLCSAGTLILPYSTWSYWAGLLCGRNKNSRYDGHPKTMHMHLEKHSPLMVPDNDRVRYIYHDIDNNNWFGSYNNSTQNVRFFGLENTGMRRRR